MFKQLIKNGYQTEVPDIWLTEGNPWEVKRNDVRFEVGFSGKTVTEKGKTVWTPGEKVGAAVEDLGQVMQGPTPWSLQKQAGWRAACGAQHQPFC